MNSPALTAPTDHELDLARIFTDRHGADLRYTAQHGCWHIWKNTHWEKDITLEVNDRARKVCEEAAVANSRIPSKQMRLASCQTVDSIERLARADPAHAAIASQWDANPWLLNTPGGVVDLRTGKLRPAAREDYMSRITAATPGGDCPQWRSFLSRFTNGDTGYEDYLQRVCGYTLTGTTTEQQLFFLYGMGANGKSVFLNTITGLLGNYSKPAPMETFIASYKENHPTELAGLQGIRLVSAIEPEEGRQWAESKIKLLTGGDPIAARFMRQDFFTFTPQFKLIIAGNHKPGLRSVNEAMRRRLKILPLTGMVPVEERDHELTGKLRKEWGGILQWMIDGCLKWQTEGLHASQNVKDATDEYLASEDLLAQWIEERCVKEGSRSALTQDLFADWQFWCQGNSYHCDSIKRFSQNLESHGFKRVHTRDGNRFEGISLHWSA